MTSSGSMPGPPGKLFAPTGTTSLRGWVSSAESGTPQVEGHGSSSLARSLMKESVQLSSITGQNLALADSRTVVLHPATGGRDPSTPSGKFVQVTIRALGSTVDQQDLTEY